MPKNAIPGLDVYEGGIRQAGIPGLDVYEDPRGPRQVRTPEGLAAQGDLRANAGPQRTGQPVPTAVPPTPTKESGLRGATDRMNRWATAIDANSAAQREGFGKATGSLRGAGQTLSAAGTAAGNVARAAVNNPLVRTVGGVGGLVAGAGSAMDARDSFASGDAVSGTLQGADALGTAAAILPRAAGSLGLAYGVGSMAGKGAYHALGSFEGGKDVLTSIGSGVNRVANMFGYGVDDSDFRRHNGLPPRPGLRTATVPASAPPKPTDLRTAGAQSSALPQLSNLVPVNDTTRIGNAYSDGSTQPNAIRNADGSARSGPGVSSLDTGEGHRQNLMELGRMRAERAEREAGFAANQPGGGLSIINAAPLGFKRVGDGPAGTTRKERMAADNNATQLSIASGRDAVSLRGQNLDYGAATARDATAREGHQLTAQTNAARLRLEQGNKDREFGQTLRSFDAGRSDAAFTQRQQREQNLQKNIESIVPMGDDGKPDTRAAAQLRTHFDRAVARLGAKGVQELGPRAEQQLIAASSLLKTMQENAGILPWKPDRLKTIDALDLTGLKTLPNGDRQITRKGQAQGQIIPGRFFSTEEGARFFGGTPTNRYDILSEGS